LPKRVVGFTVGEHQHLVVSLTNTLCYRNFAPSYRLLLWLLLQIATIDDRGQVIDSFDGQSDRLDPIWPLYSASDPETGRVFVADADCHRVLLMDCSAAADFGGRSLRLERVLLDARCGDAIDTPWRLNYSHVTGQLTVAMPDGRINVYDVR
jgi:hypothetical protein